MPHFQPLNALDSLRNRLRSELDVHRAVHAIEWGNPRVMTEALKRIRHDLGGEGNDKPAADQLQAVLLRFARSRQVASFTELKYVCYGCTVPMVGGLWRVIDQRPLFDSMLDLVNQHTRRPKQFRRCYQGLLSGYFGFKRNLEEPGEVDKRWVELRNYLSDQLELLLSASAKRGAAPEWLNALREHRNLLTSDPCSRYADALARDDQTELRRVCAGLGISSNSWVWEEALLAYVRRVCESDDAELKKRMHSVLDIVNGKTSLTLPPTIAIRATALVVARYAQCAEHPEQPALRDTCVEWIGNPWLKRTAWDAAVNHEPARLMVNSWLKQRLIKDFFGLLAADGAADLRRLRYWLKWEPQISDMWFVLGSDAQANRTPEFLGLRKRMSGRDRNLLDSNHLNNAFVMRIGQLLVIEFGVTGNACFVFAASEFKANLDKSALKTNYELKQYGALKKLTHQGLWEHKFDYELKKQLQSVPLSKGHLYEEPIATGQTRLPTSAAQKLGRTTTSNPVLSLQEKHATSNPPGMGQHHYAGTTTNAALPTLPEPKLSEQAENASDRSETSSRLRDFGWLKRPEISQSSAAHTGNSSKSLLTNEDLTYLTTLCLQHGLEWEDNRSKKGALWVLIPDIPKHLAVGRLLERMGFQHKQGKGYWLKDED